MHNIRCSHYAQDCTPFVVEIGSRIHKVHWSYLDQECTKLTSRI